MFIDPPVFLEPNDQPVGDDIDPVHDPPMPMPPIFPGSPATLPADDEPAAPGSTDDIDEDFVNFEDMAEVL